MKDLRLFVAIVQSVWAIRIVNERFDRRKQGTGSPTINIVGLVAAGQVRSIRSAACTSVDRGIISGDRILIQKIKNIEIDRNRISLVSTESVPMSDIKISL